MDVALSIGVQQMVRSDLSGSGVMFSIDTETGFPHAAVISAAWGLGEMVVQGSVNPDKYMVFKPLLQTDGACPIIEKTRGGKALKMVYAEGGSRRTRIVDTSAAERESRSEEHTSELQSLMRISYAVFCLKKKTNHT